MNVTIYPGRPAGVNFEAASVVKNIAGATVQYCDTEDPFISEGSIAVGASQTLTGTYFFTTPATALLSYTPLGPTTDAQIATLGERIGAEEEARADADEALGARTDSLESDSAATTPYVAVIKEGPINVQYPEYGALGDNSTDDTAAIQAAIDALPQTGSMRGGDIYFPPGTYLVSTMFDLDSLQGIVLRGDGGIGANQRTRLHWTPGAGSGPMIRARTADGLTIEKLKLVYTHAAYDGDLLLTGSVAGVGTTPTTNLVLRDCFLGGGGGLLAASLLNLNGCVQASIIGTGFGGAVRQIIGSVSDFANTVLFQSCYFNGASIAAIKNPGEAWCINSCSFERLTTGAAGAIVHDRGTTWRARGVTVSNCWFGDVTTNSGTWIDLHAFGLDIRGNVFDQRGMNAVKAIVLYDTDGAVVMGNNFREGAAGIEAAGSYLRGFAAIGNLFESVTVPLPTSAITSNQISIANIGADGLIDMTETGDHPAPGTNRVRLYAKDNGSGKTQAVARMNTGAVQPFATEP